MHFRLCNLALNPNEVARKMACTRWYNYMKLSLHRNFAMFISIRQTLFCYKASLTHWVHFKTTLYIASLTICKNMSAPGVAITRQWKQPYIFVMNSSLMSLIYPILLNTVFLLSVWYGLYVSIVFTCREAAGCMLVQESVRFACWHISFLLCGKEGTKF